MVGSELASELAREERLSFMKSQPNHRFVSPMVFCELAVSSRRLERFDDPVAGLRGLVDRQTGEYFLTSDDELFHHQAFA